MHTTEQILERFDEMLPEEVPAEKLYGEGSVTEWLNNNSKKHLYEDSVYGEPMLDLSKEKIKDFLRTALESVREESEKKGRNDAVDYIEKKTDTVGKGIVINIGDILEEARSITNNK